MIREDELPEEDDEDEELDETDIFIHPPDKSTKPLRQDELNLTLIKQFYNNL